MELSVETADRRLEGLELLSDMVLVEMEGRPGRIGRIVIPPSADLRSRGDCFARVIAVGPGRRLKSGGIQGCEVVPGNRVLVYFAAKSAACKWPTEKHAIIPESMIQAVME